MRVGRERSRSLHHAVWCVPTILIVRFTSDMFIRRLGEGSWHTPRTTAYTNEAELRDLLAETPSLLPGIDEGPTATAKEMPIPGAGAVDVVIVDANGDVTVVECKLRANPEIRRRVVGQLLAYASALWQMSFADFDDAFRRSEVKQSLSGLLHGNDLDEEQFRRAVEDNLTSGRFRLIIAVDEITGELKRTVSYLNSHTTTDLELLALEMRRVADEGVELLLPATYGEESADTKPPGGRSDEETVIAAVQDTFRDRPEEDSKAAERMLALMRFMQEQGARMRFGKRSAASVMAWLGEAVGNPVVVRFSPRSFSVEFVFMRDAGRSERELRRFADHLRKIPDLARYYEGLAEADYRKAPQLRPEDVLKSDEILDAFKAAIVEGARAPSDDLSAAEAVD